MAKFDVTHIIGEEGYGEQEILTENVEAENALDAIFEVAPPECRSWTIRAADWDVAGLLNPTAPNRSEEYCDYYYAKLVSL